MRALGVLGGSALGDQFSTLQERLDKFMNPDPLPGEPAPDSTIDWWCWEQPAFKECHALAFQSAQQQCNQPGIQGTKLYNACVVTGADEIAKKSCNCPTSAPSNKLSPDTKKKLIAGALFAVALVVYMYDDEPVKKKHAANRRRN